ncbi:MAG: O-antigen ligase family protein [Candidatus Cloacimonetes bacterium]|nr:O-antigen ligase family protein [Candidatus Cloacimonadota bacterium]
MKNRKHLQDSKLQTGYEKYLNYLIYVTSFLFVILFDISMESPSDGPRWILLNISAVLFPILISGYFLAVRQRLDFKISLFHVVLLLFWLYAGFSYLWVLDKTSFVEQIINLSSFVILLLFFSIYSSGISLKSVYRLSSFILSFVSLIGLMQYYGIDGKLFYQVAPPAATFVNKNLATPLIPLLLPIIGFQVLFSGSKKWSIIHSINFAISISFLIAAATKSSLIGMFLSFLITLLFILIAGQVRKNFFRKFSVQKIKYLLLIILISVILLNIRIFIKEPPEMNTDIESQLDFFMGKEKLTAHYTQPFNRPVAIRLSKWQNGLAIVRDHPVLGIGLGSFDAMYPYYHKSLIDDQWYMPRFYLGGTHNDPYQYLIELGLIGLLLLIMIFGTVFYYLIKMIFSGKIIFIPLFMGILGLLIDSLFNYPFHHPTYLFLIAFMCGKIVSSADPKKLFSLKIKPLFAFCLMLALIIFSIRISSSRYRSSQDMKLALEYRKNSNISAQYICSAVDHWKFKHRTLFMASQILYENYLKNNSDKNYQILKKYNDLTLNSLPYHYVPNLIRNILVTQKHDPDEIGALIETIPLFLRITPNEQIYDAYELVGYIYYLNKDKDNSLLYYNKVLEKFPENMKIRKRVELLMNIGE